MRRLRGLKAFLWIGLMAFFAVGIEYGALQVFYLRGATPRLVLAVLVSVSLCQGPLWGVPLALVLGFIIDALTGWGLGVAMLCCVLAAGAGLFQTLRLHADALWLAPVLSMAAVLIAEIVQIGVLYISRVIVPITGADLYRLAVSVLLTGACSFIIHLILYRQLQPAVENNFIRRYRTFR
jgi:rod shape-determining protein MreD